MDEKQELKLFYVFFILFELYMLALLVLYLMPEKYLYYFPVPLLLLFLFQFMPIQVIIHGVLLFQVLFRPDRFCGRIGFLLRLLCCAGTFAFFVIDIRSIYF